MTRFVRDGLFGTRAGKERRGRIGIFGPFLLIDMDRLDAMIDGRSYDHLVVLAMEARNLSACAAAYPLATCFPALLEKAEALTAALSTLEHQCSQKNSEFIEPPTDLIYTIGARNMYQYWEYLDQAEYFIQEAKKAAGMIGANLKAATTTTTADGPKIGNALSHKGVFNPSNRHYNVVHSPTPAFGYFRIFLSPSATAAASYVFPMEFSEITSGYVDVTSNSQNMGIRKKVD